MCPGSCPGVARPLALSTMRGDFDALHTTHSRCPICRMRLSDGRVVDPDQKRRFPRIEESQFRYSDRHTTVFTFVEYPTNKLRLSRLAILDLCQCRSAVPTQTVKRTRGFAWFSDDGTPRCDLAIPSSACSR